MTRNRVIGKDNKLPWNLPDEMQHFRRYTMNKPIILGRRTFESIGKPLPYRTNIVVTSRALNVHGIIVAANLEDALAVAEQHCEMETCNECCIIGGASVYTATLPIADRLVLTLIDTELDGDVFFPYFDEFAWQLVSEDHHPVDKRHDYAYTVKILDRKERSQYRDH